MKKTLCSTGLRWLWLAIAVVVLDLGTKQYFMQTFRLYESVAVMPFFNFTYAHNYGAAFSFLADKGGWQRWFFALIALAICIVLVVMMYKNKASAKLSNIAYALIIGGALGNLSDRLIHGFVIDFLDFYVGDWHWPTFNIADVCICIGAGLIIIESFFPDKNASPQETNQQK
ncbi:TPA: signal peptidase II [Proteus mirabilis]|uniref:signal peptidase II n=1 Tax=Proteus mirabilis TaxID=584 RepID=UPI0018C46312|nr:signal peptidase II [Proteus mirabilis]HDT0721495.1 signal peptidase II [Proteus mirabilis]HEJ9412445.1 signal peptidase II [Proteus mirabilis]HEJ9437446.1 signal peptidase II [Proteus mirabilis]HEJ9661169.1 signal peptidase II [Proteus mirabilis]